MTERKSLLSQDRDGDGQKTSAAKYHRPHGSDHFVGVAVVGRGGGVAATEHLGLLGIAQSRPLGVECPNQRAEVPFSSSWWVSRMP